MNRPEIAALTHISLRKLKKKKLRLKNDFSELELENSNVTESRINVNQWVDTSHGRFC